LRIIGVILVTVQHVLTLTWKEEDLSEWGLLGTGMIGQSGVAIFCWISGWLAIQDKRRPMAWLLQRLRVLLPAYWIVLFVSFVLVTIVKQETVSFSQMLSQFLCIGQWTHPTTLVNEPTWFVNFIVLCYLVVAVLKTLPRINLTVYLSLLGAFCIVMIALAMDLSIWPWYHFISFFTGMLLAIHFRKPPSVILIAIAFGFFGLSNFQSVFSTIASSMLIASIPLEQLRITGVKWISDHTYAYFLLHGIFLSGMVFWMPSTPMVAIPMAILFACIAAVCLQFVTRRLIDLTRALDQ
jgi:peptidoglycan/LPS O-acetylase OafA/YrhL